MRFKKQKRHRKAVRFYTTCFGFREPFKVLFDGTFVHHLLVNNITPADTAMANTLGAPVKIFTTRCVLAELRSLGESYSESFNAARNLLIAKCDHDKRKSAVSCMIDVIGEKNPEHFFVATQDAELRKKFQERDTILNVAPPDLESALLSSSIINIPGVPVVYGLRNALFIERPSALQYQFAKAAEEQRSHMSDLERKMLNVKKKRVAVEEQEDFSDRNESKEDQRSRVQAIRTTVRKKGGETKDKIQFKRKKAKGPNPLSCKRKKTLGDTNKVSSEKESQNGDTTVRSRKRKRSRKSKTVAEAPV